LQTYLTPLELGEFCFKKNNSLTLAKSLQLRNSEVNCARVVQAIKWLGELSSLQWRTFVRFWFFCRWCRKWVWGLALLAEVARHWAPTAREKYFA